MKDDNKSNNNETSITSSPKNYKYSLILKNNEIESLKKEKQKNIHYINSLELELYNLKKLVKKNFQLEVKLKESEEKCSNFEKEIDSLKKQILELKIKNKEEKRELENSFDNQLIKYKKSESQKIISENKYQLEKGELLNEISDLRKENSEMNKKNDEMMKKHTIINQIKISNLKQKLMSNLNETQNKLKELNLEYTDEATKLTLLQNHQLLIQLEYQSHLIEEMNSKNKILNDKIFALERDIEIHKQVEINLAEKNKKLNEEINKTNLIKNTDNNYVINEYSFENNFRNVNTSNNTNSNSNSNSSRYHLNYIKLQKSVRDLEKKLRIKQNEFSELKDNYDLIENNLKNYEKKYNGLFNYFEECLNLFFNDEDLKNNKEIYINIDSLKKGDFTTLNKDEKYSTLIILMKYLLPLINSSKLNNEINSIGKINNINLKFHSMGKEKINNIKKIEICKKILFNRIKNKKFYGKNNSTGNIVNSYQNSSFDYLPFINKIKNE